MRDGSNVTVASATETTRKKTAEVVPEAAERRSYPRGVRPLHFEVASSGAGLRVHTARCRGIDHCGTVHVTEIGADVDYLTQVGGRSDLYGGGP